MLQQGVARISSSREFLELVDQYADGRRFFDDETSNDALIQLREFVIDFIETHEPGTDQIWQWERNIEL